MGKWNSVTVIANGHISGRSVGGFTIYNYMEQLRRRE